ncbi:MAG TPA: GNAT family N-acetyltransferase [Acidimicrobiales bacterium]|nr:GNAT family N-acetyltransferase [Acidimicrobiales bacterium]
MGDHLEVMTDGESRSLAGDASVLLADGRTVRIRPIRPDDEERLVDFHSRLSADTIYRRFFNAHPRLTPAEVYRFTHLDYRDRFALVCVDDAGRILGVGRYDRAPGTDTAEVAFVIEDALQGQGLGSQLLRRLARVAVTYGIRRFEAQTFVDNVRMLAVFRHAGFDETAHLVGGLMNVTLDLESGPARERAHGRPSDVDRRQPQRGSRSAWDFSHDGRDF